MLRWREEKRPTTGREERKGQRGMPRIDRDDAESTEGATGSWSDALRPNIRRRTGRFGRKPLPSSEHLKSLAIFDLFSL
jgi:hypothetical protein